MKSNIAGTFLKLVAKHFPRGSKLHKIFNSNTIKASYSCTRNMGAIIKSHNVRVLNQKEQEKTPKMCNCRKENVCLRGNCLATNVIYKATVQLETGQQKVYIGPTGGPFKERYANYKSFNHEKYSKETRLSKFIWKLKKAKTKFSLKFDVIRKPQTQRKEIRANAISA